MCARVLTRASSSSFTGSTTASRTAVYPLRADRPRFRRPQRPGARSTWPSRGSLLAYGYDRESTNYTRNALENLFQYLWRAIPEVKEVSILAHSMGNWLALEAVAPDGNPQWRTARQSSRTSCWRRRTSTSTSSAQQIADMGEKQPNFTLFVSRDDRALAVSRRVWGDVSRLGSDRSGAGAVQGGAGGRTRSRSIDLTKIKAGDSLQSRQVRGIAGNRTPHRYRASPTARRLTDSRVGLGDQILVATTGTAAAVGNAAGLVLAAPVAVVDQNTRDNYADHLGSSAARTNRAATASGCDPTRPTTPGCNR